MIRPWESKSLSNNNMQHAVIYARAASRENAEAEIARQVQACESFAKQQGLHIVGRFTENASGVDQARPEFNKMLRLLDEQPSTVVVAESLARLSRRAADLWRLNAPGRSIWTVLEPDAGAFMEPVTAELKLSHPHR